MKLGRTPHCLLLLNTVLNHKFSSSNHCPIMAFWSFLLALILYRQSLRPCWKSLRQRASDIGSKPLLRASTFYQRIMFFKRYSHGHLVLRHFRSISLNMSLKPMPRRQVLRMLRCYLLTASREVRGLPEILQPAC